MAETSYSLSRHRSAALLILANVGPTIATLLHAPWPIGPLVYCGANGLWISQSLWPRGPRVRQHDGLADVWIPCLLMALGALSWAWLSQPAVTLHDGLGFDGRHYAGIYSYFRSGAYAPIEPRFPYVQRIGLPFLAAQLPFSARESFFVLHAMFWSATMVVFAISCRTAFGLPAASIQFGVLWLQVVWFSVPRGTACYTFTVDSAALFFMQAWIGLLVSGRRRWLLPVCAVVGVLFKETILLVVLLSLLALGVLCLTSRLKRALPSDLCAPRSATLAALVLAGAAAAVANRVASHALPQTQPISGSEWDTILDWLLIRTGDPLEVLRYLTAVFSAYGGFALLGVITIGKRSVHERRWPLTFATAVCGLYLAVCFVAGSDLTRFAFMAFPFALPVLLAGFERVSPGRALTALLLGLPAAHLFMPIASPFPGQEVPDRNLHGTYSWMMEYAHPAIVGSWAAWWLGCILLLRFVRPLSPGVRPDHHPGPRALR